MHNYHVNQGFRIYIVDEKGKAVTNSVDFVKYKPWQIGQGAAQSTETMQKMWLDYYTTTGVHVNEPKKKIVYLGGVKTDNVYVANVHGQINKDGNNEET